MPLWEENLCPELAYLPAVQFHQLKTLIEMNNMTEQTQDCGATGMLHQTGTGRRSSPKTQAPGLLGFQTLTFFHTHCLSLNIWDKMLLQLDML